MPFLWKTSKEGVLINKLAQATSFDPFRLELQGFGGFEPKTIFIKNKESAELRSFHRHLTLFIRRQLNLFNAIHNHGFNPHITVAFRDLKKHQFFKAWDIFKEKPFEGNFQVASFWLLKHDGKVWQAYHEFMFEGSTSMNG